MPAAEVARPAVEVTEPAADVDVTGPAADVDVPAAGATEPAVETARLAGTTTDGVVGTALLLVPVGSTEQHGPHLPLDTDTVIATAVCDALAGALVAQGVQARVGPALGYGSSGEHQSFAGTVSIGQQALRTLVVELVRSARTWVPFVALVNAHGGNLVPLRQAVQQLTDEGHHVVLLPCAPPGADLHAGSAETSLMLHLRPASVRMELAEPGDRRPLRQLLPVMVEHGVAAVSANGVLGDPTGASASHGRQLLAEMTAALLPTLLVAAGAAAGEAGAVAGAAHGAVAGAAAGAVAGAAPGTVAGAVAGAAPGTAAR